MFFFERPGFAVCFDIKVADSLYIYLQDIPIFSFLVNNITEKFAKLLAWFGALF